MSRAFAFRASARRPEDMAPSLVLVLAALGTFTASGQLIFLGQRSSPAAPRRAYRAAPLRFRASYHHSSLIPSGEYSMRLRLILVAALVMLGAPSLAPTAVVTQERATCAAACIR